MHPLLCGVMVILNIEKAMVANYTYIGSCCLLYDRTLYTHITAHLQIVPVQNCGHITEILLPGLDPKTIGCRNRNPKFVLETPAASLFRV